MSWINKHQRIRRIAFLIALAVAFSGPWFFDRIYVPAEYSCSPPNMRLDGNFCGIPISLTSFLPSLGRDFMYMASTLVTSGIDPMLLLFFLFLLLLALPFISTLTLILRLEQQGGRAVHIVILGLAAVAGALIGLLRPHGALWGIWLYTGLATSMLLVEALALRDRRGVAVE
jgi:O-antigen/teichoic acid export membrane protein